MIGTRKRVVEVDHHGISNKPLQGSPVFGNETSHHGVVLAKNRHDLFWISRFHKGGEPAKIDEEHGDFRAMSLQELLMLARHNHLGEVRGQESGYFFLLQLDELPFLCSRPNEVADAGQE